MSVLLAVSVLDQKVMAFSSPMFVRSKGEAVRSFMDACVDSNTSLSKHPEDYQLFLVGTFDDVTAVLTAIVPEMLVSGGK